MPKRGTGRVTLSALLILRAVSGERTSPEVELPVPGALVELWIELGPVARLRVQDAGKIELVARLVYALHLGWKNPFKHRLKNPHSITASSAPADRLAGKSASVGRPRRRRTTPRDA